MIQLAHSRPLAAELTEELVVARLDALPDLPHTVLLLRHVGGLEGGSELHKGTK